MNSLKTAVIILGLILFTGKLNAQFTAISGGLAFSSGVDYNTGTTGNPGLFGKAYLKVTKRFYLVPELAIFNKYNREK